MMMMLPEGAELVSGVPGRFCAARATLAGPTGKSRTPPEILEEEEIMHMQYDPRGSYRAASCRGRPEDTPATSNTHMRAAYKNR
jgi:hypothetical protein